MPQVDEILTAIGYPIRREMLRHRREPGRRCAPLPWVPEALSSIKTDAGVSSAPKDETALDPKRGGSTPSSHSLRE
jgi:hypothetical protein